MLAIGDRVLMGGALCIVERVNECAAYVRQQYAAPRVVTITDKHGEARSFEATSGGGLLAISPYTKKEA